MNPGRDDMFEYDRHFNKRLYYSFYAIAVTVAVLVGATTTFDVDFGVLSDVGVHVSSEVGSSSPLGLFYLSAIGGYFVFTFPLEAGFVAGVLKMPGWMAFLIMLSGIGVSYTLNYYSGRYLGHFIRPVLGKKSFYRWKSRLGRWGQYIIVIVNLIPVVSQAFTAVLGVFRYDWRRTLVYTSIGQVAKFGVLVWIAQSI